MNVHPASNNDIEMIVDPKDIIVIRPSLVKPSENSSLITKSAQRLQKVDQNIARWNTSQATSIPVAILNLVKSLLGAAMLSLPWAFSQSTFVPGVVGLSFSVIYSFITCMFVINGCEAKGVFEYSALLKYVHSYWETVACLTVIYVAFSSCLSYIILIGDFFADGIHGVHDTLAFPHDIAVYKAMICCCILLPLSLLKEFQSLKASSLIGNAATLYCVSLAIAYMVSYDKSSNTKMTQDNEEFVWNDWNTNILIVTNVCAKGYASQYPLPPMYEQLKHRSVPRMRLVVIAAFSIVTALYLCFAFCGYYIYGTSTQGDVLLSYPSNDVWFIVARFAMCLNVIGTYPLIFKSLLQCIEDKFFKKSATYNFVDHPEARTVVICIVSFGLMMIALFVNDVGPVSSIEGAVTILGLMSLFPVLVAWKIGTTQELKSISVQYMAVRDESNVNDTKGNQTTKRNRFVYVTYLGVVMFIGFAAGMGGIVFQITSCASGRSGAC